MLEYRSGESGETLIILVTSLLAFFFSLCREHCTILIDIDIS